MNDPANCGEMWLSPDQSGTRLPPRSLCAFLRETIKGRTMMDFEDTAKIVGRLEGLSPQAREVAVKVFLLLEDRPSLQSYQRSVEQLLEELRCRSPGRRDE